MASKKMVAYTAIVLVAFALIVAGLVVWNAQRASAAEASACDNGTCVSCVEPESCCAGAEDVQKEVGRV